MHSVCIFCGSNTGREAVYAEATRVLVQALAEAGVRIVYGGGNIGLMGVVGEAALAAGAHVIGVTPRKLLEREVVHTGLSELHVVDSMHERKIMMAEISDAFVALPGGLGTLDEIFEMLTLNQLGVQRKACGLFNVSGFFDGLCDFLDHAVAERFIRVEHREMIIVEDEPSRMIKRLRAWQMPEVSKWMDRKPV
ncbi:MAG: TIGR00730 family Rossman fold protein [Burkholderiales bacterium]|nr:TIGR00730 family Rossman fold protein [Rubrivivax sp.]MDP2398988.1 TIGR00730 family Rossman fold protein [Burkholderiales bacterium]